MIDGIIESQISLLTIAEFTCNSMFKYGKIKTIQ